MCFLNLKGIKKYITFCVNNNYIDLYIKRTKSINYLVSYYSCKINKNKAYQTLQSKVMCIKISYEVVVPCMRPSFSVQLVGHEGKDRQSKSKQWPEKMDQKFINKQKQMEKFH